MLDQQLNHLLDNYAKKFKELGVTPKENGSKSEHVAWMVQRARELNSDRTKAQRWVGFIQGYMWVHDIFTIDQLRGQVTEALAEHG
jgi:hypothetical protein